MDTTTAPMAPPSVVPKPSPRRRMPTISAEVWKEQRPRFEKLYVDMDMSLPNAMKTMEDTYAFYASEKQYKTKIKQWNLTKYVNEDQMENMLRKKKRRRTQEGKDTTFTLNGREVEQEKLVRFQKRRKLQDDEICSSTVSTASRVQYRTPSGQSPYATLAGGSPDRTGSETSSSLAPSTIVSGSRSTSTSGSDLLRLSWNGLNMRALRDMERRAHNLLAGNNPNEALEILRQVLAGYEHLLGPDADGVLEFANHMGNACVQVGNESEAEALFIRAVSGYESNHGQYHRTTLIFVASLARLYKVQGRLEDSEVLFGRAVQRLDQELPSSEQDLGLFWDLAWVYHNQNFGEKACIWYKRALVGFRKLGPGHEDTLSHIETSMSIASVNVQDPAMDSWLDDMLASCEARNGANHESVFIILCAICTRHRKSQDYEKCNVYHQKLRPIAGTLFAKDATISDDLLYHGIYLAHLYFVMGRDEEAESLFRRLRYEMDEAVRSLPPYYSRRFRSIRLFEIMRLQAEHCIRQSMWDDAEPFLLKAKLFENPFCRRIDSELLVEALKTFRIGSGREAGALSFAQQTPVIAAGSADFQQPFEDVDWSNFPLPSPGVLSPQWSSHQPPTPEGASRAGPSMEWAINDMMGMQDMVP